jgi:iron(III) transport system permease protein
VGSAFLLVLPIATVVGSVFAGPGESLAHLAGTVLPRYVGNTVLLSAGVLLLSAVWGIVPAWLITRYAVPFRGLLDWALILPLALPSYIAAYAYAGFLDYTGPLQAVLRSLFAFEGGSAYLIPIASLPGLIWVMSLVLYPYVYVVMRTAFARRVPRLLEAARTLGERRSVLLRVGIPATRPALAAGLALVLMETLNAYGAPFYFGVDTLTTGIFRTWFSLHDLLSATQLSVILLLLVALVVALEGKTRGRRGFADSTPAGAPYTPEPLSRGKRVAALAVTVLPFLFGAVIPLLTLGYWGFLAPESTSLGALARLAGTTVATAGVAASLAVGLGVLFAYVRRLSSTPLVHGATDVATLGYAVPGAIIAVGVIIVTTRVESEIAQLLEAGMGIDLRAFLTGTLAALLFAYLVRYLAVAFRPINAGVEQLGSRVDEAARSLGASARRRLWRVELPLLKRTLASAFVVVFIDVAKELPLTLVLRPFDFRTLAVRAFELASDERIAESALPSLVLVGVGVGVVMITKRILDSALTKR